jgi:hypothetical protein
MGLLSIQTGKTREGANVLILEEISGTPFRTSRYLLNN